MKGGSEEADLDYEQFSSLLNLINQNDFNKKVKMIIFEKNRIIGQNSKKKLDFERFLNYFSENEDEFFDLVRIIFANSKNTQES